MEPHPDLVAEREARLKALGPEPRWWRFLARRRWRARRRAIMATDVSQMAWMFRKAYPTQSVVGAAERRSPTFAALSAIGRDPSAPRRSEQQDALTQRRRGEAN